MRLDQIKIKNYRNLDGIELKLDPKSNFLVGENDLGKSSFLDLLDKVFNGKFKEEDFLNEKESIQVNFSLLLDDNELGSFNDLFDPNDNHKININAELESPDDYINYFHAESGESIHRLDIRRVNFIRYDSLRKPADELNFYRTTGVSKLLNFIVKNMLKGNNNDLVNKDDIGKIVEGINDKFRKIRIFEEFEIETCIEDDQIDLVSRILSIKDGNNVHISKRGHGVQFSVLIILSILEKLRSIMTTKTSERYIFDKDGTKSISLILGLDEPEIHLHPYKQRSLMKYIENIISNKEEGFLSLIKEIFGIDLIHGQSIVVTHSPNILTNDYKQITRFCRKNGVLKVKSGSTINLDDKLPKHLLKNSPYIKEAFFSRCNVLVEGDSEYGAFPVFAEKMNLDLDELGISIIQAGSAESIPPLAKLLNSFDIDNVGIMDQDKLEVYEDSEKVDGINLNFTAYADFEEEIYKAFKIEDYIKFIETILPNNKCFFRNTARDLGITIDCSQSDLYKQVEILSTLNKHLLKKSLEEDCTNFLGQNKTVIFGRKIANHVSRVPYSYRNLLKNAERLCNEQDKVQN